MMRLTRVVGSAARGPTWHKVTSLYTRHIKVELLWHCWMEKETWTMDQIIRRKYRQQGMFMARRHWWIVTFSNWRLQVALICTQTCSSDSRRTSLYLSCLNPPQQQTSWGEEGTDADVWRTRRRKDQYLLRHPRGAHVLHVQDIWGPQRLRGVTHHQHLPDKEGEVGTCGKPVTS